MTDFLAWLRETAGASARILLRQPALGRQRMLAAYLEVAQHNRFGTGRQQEQVLGQNIAFYDYSIFATIFAEVFLTDVYFFRSTGRPRIADAGANIGVSVAYFKALYPDCHVLAFEPD